jgi:hypothetical protein
MGLDTKTDWPTDVGRNITLTLNLTLIIYNLSLRGRRRRSAVQLSHSFCAERTIPSLVNEGTPLPSSDGGGHRQADTLDPQTGRRSHKTTLGNRLKSAKEKSEKI